jgi:rhodanese-related sulfurtransferase
MKDISPEELSNWISEKKEFLLVDVRESYERSACSIGGIHIPLGDLFTRKDEISQDKPVVFYCEKGIRSAIAIQRLESTGFANLYNLTGGVKNWKHLPPYPTSSNFPP